MFELIKKFFMWLYDLWNGLPPATKERIINVVVDVFEHKFRSYYNSQKGGSNV